MSDKAVEVTRLRFLRVLELQHNNLTALPRGFGQLRRLRELLSPPSEARPGCTDASGQLRTADYRSGRVSS